MEKKIETKDWSMRVNLSILSMIVVDTWLVYSTFKNTPAGIGYNQKEFYAALAEELIDNSYGNTSIIANSDDVISRCLHQSA